MRSVFKFSLTRRTKFKIPQKKKIQHEYNHVATMKQALTLIKNLLN
jgi:hypothetical protein